MSEIRSPNGRDRSAYAVCGLGPAGCGFLAHAIREGVIGQIVDQGLVLIDRSALPGPGKISRYQLTGNSLSRAFLDCVDDPKLAWLFGDLAAMAPAVLQLRSMEHIAPPLNVVSRFLTALADRTLSYLASQYGVPVLLQTSVEAIQRRIDGSFTLTLRDIATGVEAGLHTDHVLCGFGGRQDMDVIRQCQLQPGLRLGDHAAGLIPSDDFLMMSNEQIRRAIPMPLAGRADIVVIGASHSAMSTIDRLADSLGPVGLRRIIMLHKDPLRLYYASASDAERDGYAFDATADICPMSGRVNRFGGLRYRSFDVARAIIETGKTPDQTVDVLSVSLRDQHAARLGRYLAESAAVIPCLGYQANLPPLFDVWRQPVALQNMPRGIEVDDHGRALLADGQPLPGLFVHGIGSRLLKRSAAIGGEPSFQGSADGVWLYHNHGGGVILNALGSTFSGGAERSGSSDWRSDHVRVVNQQ